jgi:hypothetical protein
VRHLSVATTLAACALCASLAQAQTLLGVRQLSVFGRQLFALDPDTGVVTALGPVLEPPMSGADNTTAVDRAGNRLFKLGVRAGEVDQRVYSIALQTGTLLASPTLVGGGVSFHTLEWDAGEGVLFGLRGTLDGPQLATIDPTTGAFTNIGTPVPLVNSASGATLDASGNRFFFVGFHPADNVRRLFVVDTATGAFTEPAIPSFGNSVVDLEWDAGEGVLYALRVRSDATPQLATIDPVTAVVTPFGTGSVTPVNSYPGISALDEAGNRFFMIGTRLGENDARLYSFDTTDGSVEGNPTLFDSGIFGFPYVGIEWESTPLPVTLLGLTVE